MDTISIFYFFAKFPFNDIDRKLLLEIKLQINLHEVTIQQINYTCFKFYVPEVWLNVYR